MKHRWNKIDREKPKYSGKTLFPVPLCPPQIPHEMTRNRTRAFAVRGRQLTAWAMARPKDITYLWAALEHKFKEIFYPRTLLEIRTKYVFQKN
jgi:hypothetical protein